MLHAAYQELPPEEIERLRTKARVLSEAVDGTAVRRVWPFRNRFNKAVVVARQKQRRIQWHRRRDLQGDGQVLDQIITDALASQATPEEMVAAASRSARLESAMLRDAGRAAEVTLASFRGLEGQRATALCEEAMLATKSLHHGAFMPFPCNGLRAFDFAPDSAALAEHTLFAAKATARQGNQGKV